jgi:ATP-dependent RNA helicase RhlE
MFRNFGLDDSLVRAIDGIGFVEPTPIQKDAIPAALEGRDVLACATTGTGKTAAFLLPILQRLGATPSATTRALVLTPTRELAAQVHDHFGQLSAHSRLRAAAIFGGVAMGPQLHAVRRGADVLVATPGRLLDLLQQVPSLLDRVEILVLDEADRMLDMGFLPDVRRILSRVPKKRQSLLFSATMPPSIAALAREMLNHPVSIDLQRRAAPAEGIRQAVYPVPQDRKTDLLVELLSGEAIGNALVFTRTKHRATRLAIALSRRGVASAPIHGDRSQAQRTKALASFRAGDLRVLVATDIASRGIDVEKLSHVVNYDVPGSSEDYIHRVGRTARAKEVGDALTFVSPAEEPDLRSIESALPDRLERLTLAGFDYRPRREETGPTPLRSAGPPRRSAPRVAGASAAPAGNDAKSPPSAQRRFGPPAAAGRSRRFRPSGRAR